MGFVKVMLKKRLGQSVIEFVIVLPIILFVCTAILSIGMYIYCKTLVVTAATQASKHGAYLYQLNSDPYNEGKRYAEIRSKVMYYIEEGVPIPDDAYVQITVYTEEAIIDYKDGDVKVGNYLIVRVSFPFQFVFPLAEVIFGEKNSIPITYEAKSLYLTS